MSILDAIRAKLDTLTAKQRSIAQYLLEAPDEASYLSLKELSVRTQASEVSVLRLCKALGFESFVALKEALRTHTQETFRAISPSGFLMCAEKRPDGTPEQQLAQICLDDQNNLASMIGQLDPAMLFRCARSLRLKESSSSRMINPICLQIICATDSIFCESRLPPCSSGMAIPFQPRLQAWGKTIP